MRVAIASDHGGLNLKQEIIRLLEEKKVIFKDFGATSVCAKGCRWRI